MQADNTISDILASGDDGINPKVVRDADGNSAVGVYLRQSDLSNWKPVVTQIRDAILARSITGASVDGWYEVMDEAHHYLPSAKEVSNVGKVTRDAVNAGRVIDFGHLPNQVMMRASPRGNTLWEAGALALPFTDPWIFCHTWEGGTSIYVVSPEMPEDVVMCELLPYRYDNRVPILLLGDRMMLFRDREDSSIWKTVAFPFSGRFRTDKEAYRRMNGDKTPQLAAVGNLADPFLTALLILNTRNVERQTVRVADKLQKARARNGKPPIPPHDVVFTQPYVTALSAKRTSVCGDPQGGTHASPTPHIRMGHPRHYKSGRLSLIADTLVNVPQSQREAFKANRSHYAFKGDNT